ncbi:helix-turn-helix domain-containing protein [Corynebacterium sp. S7]
MLKTFATVSYIRLPWFLSHVTVLFMTVTQQTMTLNEAIGAKVDQIMFRRRITRKALGEALGITGAGVSRKLYGQTAWTTEDLYVVADVLGVEVTDLLPRRVEVTTDEKTPSEEGVNRKKLVAGAGFEPTTSGL